MHGGGKGIVAGVYGIQTRTRGTQRGPGSTFLPALLSLSVYQMNGVSSQTPKVLRKEGLPVDPSPSTSHTHSTRTSPALLLALVIQSLEGHLAFLNLPVPFWCILLPVALDNTLVHRCWWIMTHHYRSEFTADHRQTHQATSQSRHCAAINQEGPFTRDVRDQILGFLEEKHVLCCDLKCPEGI